MSRYVREYVSYPYASHYIEMHTGDRAWTVRNRHNMLCNTDIGAWATFWLPCAGRGMFVSHCVGSQGYCTVVRFWKRSNMKWICLCLCSFLMGSCYLTLVRRLSSWVFWFIICISLSASISGRLNSTLSLVRKFMAGEYLLACITSNCW